jgi:MFS family permease
MCLLLFSSLIAIGQVIFSLGISIKSWPVIFLGRLVFGFGGESFTVANSALLAEWFKGKELALAFGINLSISKLGSVINNILSPMLANNISIVFALWFGAILCGFGIVCVVLVFPIDRHLDELLEKQQKYIKAMDDPDGDSQKQLEDDADAVPSQAGQASGETASFRDVLKLKHIFWVLVVSCVVVYGCVLPFNNISSSLLLERDYFMTPPSNCQLTDPLQCESGSNPPIHCPSSKWYQPPLPDNYSTYNPLTTDDIDCSSSEWKDGCTSEYCSRLADAETQASFVMSIPYIISAALSPPVGFLVDIYGFRAVIATLAPVVLIIVHMFLAVTNVSAIGPLVGQGLAYTGFVSVLWPSVPLVVDENVTGLAFGIVTSMQNLACAIIPLIVASIYADSGDKYIPDVEYLFVILASVGVVVGIYLNYYDFYNGNVLNSPYQANAYDPVAKEEGAEAPMLNPLITAEEHEPPRSKSRQTSSARDNRDHEDDFGFHSERTMSQEMRHRQSRHSRNSRGGSFTSYEEVTRAGRYKNH